MAQRETWLQTDLQKPAQVQVLRGVMFSQDNQGDLVGVTVYDNGQPAQLSGTVLGYIIKDNGDTVTITGTLQENRAWIVLPANAYDVVGMIHIAIQLKANSTQTSPILTLGMCAVYVQRTQTGNIVTPEYRILDVEAILEMIDDVNAATAAANAAAENADTKAGLADTAATRADAAAAALEDMDASASTLTSGSDATAQITTVSGHYRALFGIPKGDTGATGPAPQITSTVTTYQESSSGSAVPSGAWQNAIPNPLTQGMFLWTKLVITYDTGDTLTQYSVSHQGLDGTGSVNSVDGVSPDVSGNVALTANDIPISAQDSTKVAAAIVGKADKVSGAVNGNLAGLDANGNLTDSGSKASDFQTALTFDAAPTQSSTNPVTSGGVYSGLADAQAAMAIVVSGDTAPQNITAGRFVYVKNHSTLAAGLYHATADIASGATLSSSNLAADPEGGLNSLYSKMPVLLWTNPNVSATGEATIASGIDFKGFTLFAVRVKVNVSVSKYVTQLVSIGDSTQISYVTDSQTQNANVWYRYIAINNGNIYVENATRGDGTNNTNVLIPEALYGIM